MLNHAKTLGQWMLLENLMALYDTGVLTYLEQQSEPQTVAAISAATDTRDTLVRPALNYVTLHVPELLERDSEGLYRLNSGDHFVNILQFARAYRPVMHSLPGLLAGDTQYGTDVMRDGNALSVSSEYFTKYTLPDLTELVRQVHPELIVDLGCGSGHAVRHLVRQVACKGVGIDEKKPGEDSVDVEWLVGDVAEPQNWQKKITPQDPVFVACYVFHEFLESSVAGLQQVFERYRAYFPGAWFFMVEVTGRSELELAALPDGEREAAAAYQFIHPLTNQGSPQSEGDWRAILEQCGVTELTIFPTTQQSRIYRFRI